MIASRSIWIEVHAKAGTSIAEPTVKKASIQKGKKRAVKISKAEMRQRNPEQRQIGKQVRTMASCSVSASQEAQF